jgi:hypothetical protein
LPDSKYFPGTHFQGATGRCSPSIWGIKARKRKTWNSGSRDSTQGREAIGQKLLLSYATAGWGVKKALGSQGEETTKPIVHLLCPTLLCGMLNIIGESGSNKNVK